MAITLITEEEKEVVRMVGVIRKDDIVNYALNVQRSPKRYKKVTKFVLNNLHNIYEEASASTDWDWLLEIDAKNIELLEDQQLSDPLIGTVSMLIMRAAYALSVYGRRHGCNNTRILIGTDEFIIKELPTVEHAMIRMLNTKSGWVIPREA